MVDHFVHMVEYRLKSLRRAYNEMTILQRPVWIAIGVLLILMPVSGWAWVFAEGYSSEKPSMTARLTYREFTIHTGQDACSDSPVPFEFRVYPNPITLKVGERIHRTEHSELIVEAYDEAGLFLPAVPLVVTVIDSMTVARSRSDWDYFEAIAEGEAELLIAWYCLAGKSANHGDGQLTDAGPSLLLTACHQIKIIGDAIIRLATIGGSRMSTPA